MLAKLRIKTHQLLRWSEKYTKTDMVYLAKGGFWTMTGQIISSVLSLVLIIVLANLLPKDTYGLYKYILSIAGILNIFTLTGMNSAVSQAVATGDDGALRSSVRYQLRWNLLMLLAFLCLSIYYFLNDNSTIAISLLVMGIFTPLTCAFNTYGAYLHSKKNFYLNNIFSIISVAVYVTGMIIISILGENVIWLITTYTLTTFITTATFYFITLKKYSPPLTSNSDYLAYGKKITFIGFIGPISSQIDSIIINHFWGPTQLAIYSLAMAIPTRATTFIKDWVNISFPKLAIKSTKEIDSFFYQRIFQGLFIGLICSVIYIILAPYFFTYAIPKYLDGLFYSQLLAIGLIFAIPSRYIGLLMVARKLSKLMFLNSIIQSTIRILLYIILGIWGGLLGLIIAQIICSILGLVIIFIIWKFYIYKNKKTYSNKNSIYQA